MKKFMNLLFFVIIFSVFLFSSCGYCKEIDYYSDRNNYIVATGVVDFINFTDDKDGRSSNRLYIGFSDISEKFEDNCFVVIGRNMDIVLENGIETKLNVGDKVTFVAAPKVFGDGYVLPIVSMTIDEEELLGFDEGYLNLLEWLKNGSK